jgi:raffinose/stachyose/melibiose transport system substrate-binding protein
MSKAVFQAIATALLAGSASTAATAAELVVESWRNDDLSIWQDQIVPAFEKANPGIKITFSPTAPADYNAALNAKLDAGVAGDIITCRPFDASLEQFKKGQLADLTGLPGLDRFTAFAKAAWSTDDGKTTFCVPIAAVIHGFIYNKDAFGKLGLSAPTTVEEFYAALDRIKQDGTYVPLAMGTKDQWEAATMGWENIGPTYWKGEEGRLALIEGTAKLTDPGFVEPFRQIAKWAPYLGDGFQAQAYPDSQNVFTLGRAAIYPAGSWEISGFRAQAKFAMGLFRPPVLKAGDTCYISDHVDLAAGLNAKSANVEAARKFLAWVATAEFAGLYSNALPGFFPLYNGDVPEKDPLAQEFVGWRSQCKSTIRASYQILSRGTPNLENELWVESANVVNGTDTPGAAAKKLQDGLASWYGPQKGK